MICLAVALGFLGFAAMRRARGCHGPFGYGWHGPYGYGFHHHHRGHGRHGTWVTHALLSRIDASPAQERAIIAELEKLEDRVHGAKAGLRDARGDFAAAMRGPALDDAALGGALGRVDAAGSEVRTALIDAVRAIHGLLDNSQRAKVADMIDHGGGGGWWRGAGPYR